LSPTANLGLALADRGELDDAIIHYRKALEIKPDFAEGYYDLGLALAAADSSTVAIAHYRAALQFKRDISRRTATRIGVSRA